MSISPWRYRAGPAHCLPASEVETAHSLGVPAWQRCRVLWKPSCHVPSVLELVTGLERREWLALATTHQLRAQVRTPGPDFQVQGVPIIGAVRFSHQCRMTLPPQLLYPLPHLRQHMALVQIPILSSWSPALASPPVLWLPESPSPVRPCFWGS